MKRAGMFYAVVSDFKVHHPRPNTLGRRDFFKLTEFTAPFWALPVSFCGNVVALAFPVPGWLMALMMTLIIGNAMAQYFHATLHRKNTPLPISLLRRVGLLMSPPAHQIHHDTLDRDFAFITGWSNPLLNRIFNVLLKRAY